jgi:hypothetical protein
VIRFYWALARQAPEVLWRSTNHALAVFGVVIFVAGLLNREWADYVADWGGFSPWWVVVAVVLVFLYWMAWANYERVRDADAKAEKQAETEAKLRQTEEVVRLQTEQLADCERRYRVSQEQYKVFRDFDEEHGRG